VVSFAERVELRFDFGCCGRGGKGEGFVMVRRIGMVRESGGEGPGGEERCFERQERWMEAEETNCRSEWRVEDHGGGRRAIGSRLTLR